MPIATMNDTPIHWRIGYMDELESPQIPFPPVEAYAEEEPALDSERAFLVVRESLDTHLMHLLEDVRSLRTPATQEDVRRLVQVRAVVLGALETLQP